MYMKFKKIMSLSLMAVVISVLAVSCSDETDVPNEESAKIAGVKGNLVGTWYGEYHMEGQTTESANSIAGTYIKAVQALKFNADGTGSCTKFLCNAASEPLSIYGGEMDRTNGRFRYSVNGDGSITVTRDGSGDKNNPKTWTMTLANGVLNGTDGNTKFNMSAADDNRKAMVATWEETLRGGGNDGEQNKSFLTDWPRCEKVYINGITAPQYLPWAKNNSAQSDIPEYILTDINPADGWEMAFCSLSDPSAQKTRYFGLYNRYTGVLRVFMYIPDASAYGNEMAFDIACGTSGDIRYPFYNAMDYCIPVNKPYSAWDKTKHLSTGTSSYSVLSWRQTPYTEKTEANGVSAYWHCFDIDMSGYSPVNKKAWRKHIGDNLSLLSISPVSQNTTQIKLTGALIGKVAGDFSSESTIKSAACNPHLHRARLAMGGMGSILTSLVSIYGSAASVSKSFSDFGAYTAMGVGVAGILFNTVGVILSGSDDTEEKNVTKGTIDLRLNADIDLDGVMSGWKSLTDGGLRITPAVLDATNPKGSIGKGCIGLEEAPVVYISKEDLLSEYDHVKITKNEGDDYYTYVTDEPDLRFVAFLDPASVKVNLNKDIYSNIRNLKVTSFTGVNAARPLGHSDSYRRLAGLNPRPELDLGKGVINLSTTSGKIKLTNLAALELMMEDPLCYPEGEGVTDQIKRAASPVYVEQTGDEIYRYFGSALKLAGSHVVLVPQAYLPYKNDRYLAPQAPDFLVGVIVTFDCDEKKGVTFIKQFIPEYKFVTHADLKNLYTQMQDYSDKSKNKESVGHLANDNSVPVYDYNGYLYMQWTLKMLKEVTSK